MCSVDSQKTTPPKSKSKLLYAWWSVSMSWCRAPLWGPLPDFTFSFCFAGKLLCCSSWCALSDERTGLQFVVQSVSGQSRGGLITIHYCLIWDYWVPFPSPLATRSDYGGSILTRLYTGNYTTNNELAFYATRQMINYCLTMQFGNHGNYCQRPAEILSPSRY
jgi:hypothetical protein